MCIVYGLNYLDKTTLSYASIMGLRLPPSDNKLKSGIDLKGNEYQWLGSMFYFGYIAWEYPTTRLLQILPLGKYCMSCPFAHKSHITDPYSGFQRHHVGTGAVVFCSG
jgi:hypothetical protein